MSPYNIGPTINYRIALGKFHEDKKYLVLSKERKRIDEEMDRLFANAIKLGFIFLFLQYV